MLIAQIVKEAMLTAHDVCEAERQQNHTDYCKHAKPIAMNTDLLLRRLAQIVQNELDDPDGRFDNLTATLIATFSHAFHVGYRAAQLEAMQDEKPTTSIQAGVN